ncbi:MAG: hypothetical protein HYZ28_25415 [Myxococcales bacterium]|nr:hypothetical protein [Myxococcales bacterium]
MDAEVNSAPAPWRVRTRAAMLLATATLIALVPCALIFLLVLHGDWMNGAFEAIVRFMLGQPWWAVLAATSPVWAVLLLGYGYTRRAMRRRAAERKSGAAK